MTYRNDSTVDPRRADALRRGARNGSPFTADRAFRRPSPRAVRYFRAARDLLAVAALTVILGAVALALASPLHWA